MTFKGRDIGIVQPLDIYMWQFHLEKSAAYKSAMNVVI